VAALRPSPLLTLKTATPRFGVTGSSAGSGGGGFGRGGSGSAGKAGPGAIEACACVRACKRVCVCAFVAGGAARLLTHARAFPLLLLLLLLHSFRVRQHCPLGSSPYSLTSSPGGGGGGGGGAGRDGGGAASAAALLLPARDNPHRHAASSWGWLPATAACVDVREQPLARGFTLTLAHLPPVTPKHTGCSSARRHLAPRRPPTAAA
jgi:hypothetical protein